MLEVEDWAEIRRLRKAEKMPIKGDRSGGGVFEEHGEEGAGRGRSAGLSPGGACSTETGFVPVTSSVSAARTDRLNRRLRQA